MPEPQKSVRSESNRREFLQKSAAASAALGAVLSPGVAWAGGSDVLRVGLIGCGGRGAGAAIDSLSADPNTQLVAIGDTFPDRAASCLETLRENSAIADRVNVDADHIFSGFENYKHVIDSGVDVVLLATPPHFRPQHMAYAVEKGKHLFVEKPVAVDIPGIASVKRTCEEAKRRGLSVVSGLCYRYNPAVSATIQKIQDGAIGDVIAIQSCFNAGTLWHRGREASWSEMEYQIRNWLYFTWLSGDHIVEQGIHSLDKTAWLNGDTSPVRAMGIGGRQQRTQEKYGNIYDHHVVFYEYPSGVRVYFTCRQQDGTSGFIDEIVMGTKGTARLLTNRIEGETNWRYQGPKPSHYVAEHQAMYKGIRSGSPLNNGYYMTNSNLIAILGRMCTYTGKDITWEQMLASEESLGTSEYAWGDAPHEPIAIPGVNPRV